MKEIIEWLIGIEDEAHKVYERAAMQLKDDREYADLLWRLAKDEKVHYEFMCKAAELVNSDLHPPPEIVEVSSAVKQKAENYFLLCEKKDSRKPSYERRYH
jgi:rubrerythrin